MSVSGFRWFRSEFVYWGGELEVVMGGGEVFLKGIGRVFWLERVVYVKVG